MAKGKKTGHCNVGAYRSDGSIIILELYWARLQLTYPPLVRLQTSARTTHVGKSRDMSKPSSLSVDSPIHSVITVLAKWAFNDWVFMINIEDLFANFSVSSLGGQITGGDYDGQKDCMKLIMLGSKMCRFKQTCNEHSRGRWSWMIAIYKYLLSMCHWSHHFHRGHNFGIGVNKGIFVINSVFYIRAPISVHTPY